MKSKALPFLNFDIVHPSWHECLERGLLKMNPDYLTKLSLDHRWLPGPENIFKAFSLPLTQVNYVLFGESPYPRRESANGYAFWDADVTHLWSQTGLNKKVNRATSLRNIIKMLLVAEQVLQQEDVGQQKIALIDKKDYVQTINELFSNLLTRGFLLLNATPVYHFLTPQQDARHWLPFTQELLDCLLQHRPKSKFILLGNIANKIAQLIDLTNVTTLFAEHPYNHTFVTNPKVLNFFRPLHLLRARLREDNS